MVIRNDVYENYHELTWTKCCLAHITLIVKWCPTPALAFMTPNTRGLTEAPIVTLYIIARSSMCDIVFCDVNPD